VHRARHYLSLRLLVLLLLLLLNLLELLLTLESSGVHACLLLLPRLLELLHLRTLNCSTAGKRFNISTGSFMLSL
jgi:hypothetical protein